MGKGHSTVGRGMFPTPPLRWLPGILSTSRLPEPVTPRDHSPRALLLQPAPAAPGWPQGQQPRPCLRDTSQSEPTAERDPWAVRGQAQLLGQGCQPPAPLQSGAHAAPYSPGLVLSLRLLRPSCLRGPGELGRPEGFGCSAWLRALRPCNTDKILSSPRCARCGPLRGRT